MRNRHYETIFILTPVLSESQLEETSQKFKNILEEQGANVYHTEAWGMRKLAYPINRKKNGHYFLFQFDANPEIIKKLETEYSRDENIIRYLTIVMDKNMLAFSEKRRSGAFNKKEEATTEEAK
jgi:small subunit ribosomal protein S6